METILGTLGLVIPLIVIGLIVGLCIIAHTIAVIAKNIIEAEKEIKTDERIKHIKQLEKEIEELKEHAEMCEVQIEAQKNGVRGWRNAYYLATGRTLSRTDVIEGS